MTAKKAFKLVLYILLYSLLVASALAVLFMLTSQKSETGATQVFGYQLLTVGSASMESSPDTDVSNFEIKSIPEHSLVFVKTKPKDKSALDEWYSSLKIGDVLSFRYQYVQQVTVTHRITNITANSDGGYLIELMGDNSPDAFQIIDTSLDESGSNYIIGKVEGQSRLLGGFIYALRNPIGLTFIIIIPCVVIISIEVLRIVSVFNKNSRQKLLEEQQLKDAEIAALRERIAELEEREEIEETEETEEKTNSSNE